MKDLTATEVARNFSDVLDEVERDREPVMIHRRGKPVAVLQPLEGTPNGDRVLEAITKYHVDDEFWDDVLRARTFLVEPDPVWRD